MINQFGEISIPLAGNICLTGRKSLPIINFGVANFIVQRYKTAMKYAQEYRTSDIVRSMVDRIHRISRRRVRFMEVCGTHTMSIFRHGIRSLLPETITLLSGPGCPVCVTAQSEIDAFIKLAGKENVILTSFGDLLKVPGNNSSLQQQRAIGKDVRIVYSTVDALEIARKYPDKKIVFAGVGFETTAPTVAASILSAKAMNLDNFFVFSAHKRVPPALFALMNMKNIQIDGFILPGHVSLIIGMKAYRPFFEKYHLPCVAAGFEPADILRAVQMLVEQIESGCPKLENAYERAVSEDGNPKAVRMMEEVFENTDAEWRGIGKIPDSGLAIRDEFADYDAKRRFEIDVADTENPKGCICGQILTGLKIPPDCPLYKKVCTPENPTGPCMVSTEGTCAAYYRFSN
jgi:hydrogenase expression/formation protein HypD